MDEDDECNGLRQVLEKKCPSAKFRGEDIKKLVDAGYDTEVALMAASKDSLDRVLPTRPGAVDFLVKAFVQSTVSAAEPNESVKEVSQISLQLQQLQKQMGDIKERMQKQMGDIKERMQKQAEDVKEQVGDIKKSLNLLEVEVPVLTVSGVKYEPIRFLGSGATSNVFCVRDVNGREYAAKNPRDGMVLWNDHEMLDLLKDVKGVPKTLGWFDNGKSLRIHPVGEKILHKSIPELWSFMFLKVRTSAVL